MTDDQEKQMQAKLDEIVAAAAVLLAMIQHVKGPTGVPSPFSGPGEER